MPKRWQISLSIGLIVLAGLTLAVAGQGITRGHGGSLGAKPRYIRDITYAEADGRALKLDALVLPPGEQPRPMVLMIHGGGWQAGDKADNKWLMQALAVAGYVTFSANYRLSQEAVFPAQIEDCKAALRFIRAHAAEYGGDPGRIGVCGASAGGHLAALLGVSGGVAALEGAEGVTGVSSSVQAVCDWFGPSDFTAAGDFSPDVMNMAVQLLGADPSSAREKAALASPVTYVDAKDPPFMIIQGLADPIVPPIQSQRLAQALRGAGVAVELIEVPAGGHGGFDHTTPNTGDILARMVAFFNRTLR